MSLSSIRSWFAKGNRANWCVFIVLFLSVFVQLVLFEYVGHHYFLFSSMWKNPQIFVDLYLSKIAISFILGGLLMFCRRKIECSIFLYVIFVLWIEANLIYLRTNNLLIDAYALSMIENMSGFWGSILTYIEPIDFSFLIISIVSCILIVVFYSLTSPKYNIVESICILSVGIILQIISQECRQNYLDINVKNTVLPFKLQKMNQTGAMCVDCLDDLVKGNSIVHLFFWDLWDLCHINHYVCTIPHKDAIFVANFCNGKVNNCIIKPNSKLIILLIESFESWVIQKEVTPNLENFIHSNHVLYSSKITSQIRQGTSADGQMIVNCGILPIQKGATAFLYPDNTYPSIMGLCGDSTLIILPHDEKVWNQIKMTRAYGIHHTKVTNGSDSTLLVELNKAIDEGYEEVYLITMSTHAPFVGAKHSLMSISPDMPLYMADYEKAFNAFDSCFGDLFNRLENDTILQSYTIVLTGDHTIFSDEKIIKYNEYCENNHLNYRLSSFCPLIIYSPSIEGNIQITDTCYQMDIYPTIMHLIGCEDYYWKGFGVNLLDSVARHNRPISEQEAYRLSDMMIRSDYFRQYLHK